MSSVSVPAGEVTALIRRIQSGDSDAWEPLTEKVYPELRRIAAAHFRNERPGHLLRPTALVHEVWLKLVAIRSVEIDDRVHFFSLCSRLMRRILVDEARRRKVHEKALEVIMTSDRADTDALELDRALKILEETQPRAARVVELRYFAGMSIEEIAEVLDISAATVKRDWLAARAWLYGQLTGAPT